MIYFVQAEVGGPVKIGYAADPEARLVALQCGSPFRLRVYATVTAETVDIGYGALPVHGPLTERAWLTADELRRRHGLPYRAADGYALRWLHDRGRPVRRRVRRRGGAKLPAEWRPAT